MPVSNASSNNTSIRVFLIGMMGTGKTYWAEKLKKRLKVPAYDLDNLIELMDERSIVEIFEQSGESYFRKEEAKMVRLFGEKKQFILSCGGGTPCFGNNMQWMNEHGTTIWIDEPVEILSARLEKEKNQRPLIKHLAGDTLPQFLLNRLEERTPYYSQSKYRLSGVNITESNLIQTIKNA